MKIKEIKAREILASGADPSIEVTVTLEDGTIGEASVPYGASAGVHEAAVLLDGDKSRYNGNGMLTAVKNVNEIIAPKVIGMDAADQRGIDTLMNELDGTENKSKLGGNSILGVSLAVARAEATAEKMPLYKYIRKALSLDISEYRLPNPMMVVIEGGKHADNSTDLQEFLFSLTVDSSAKESVRAGIEVYKKLKGILKANKLNTNVGNEGAFAPSGMPSNQAPLDYMMQAISELGLKAGDEVGLSIDAAASEFYKSDENKYELTLEGKKYSAEELVKYYKTWFPKYPMYTVEDMLHEDDWDNWPKMTSASSESNIVNIGDDLTVTNPIRLQKAIDTKAITGILIKLNQIGSLTETVDTCMLARKNGLITVTSHRGGGETNDTFMVDLAVAVNSAFIKVGPSRGERVCKYNRLMRIEEELGSEGKIMGTDFRKII